MFSNMLEEEDSPFVIENGSKGTNDPISYTIGVNSNTNGPVSNNNGHISNNNKPVSNNHRPISINNNAAAI